MAEPVMMFHIGTNNWQRQGEFAPGSGILHKSMHETFNSMPGVKCYSMYPSKMQTDPTDDSTFKIFKINHDIPICESVSPNSSYRWHSMNDVEFTAYTKRLEDEICAFMDEIEKKEGRQFDYLVSHHAFTNAMAGAQIVDRRQKEGNKKLRHFNFVHGTALKMYIKEKEKDPEYPMRFLQLVQNHGVFNSLGGCAGIWVNSVDYIAKFADCFPTYPKDNLVFSRIGVNQNIFCPKGTTVDGDLPKHLRAEDQERFASSGVKRLVAFVGKFADWKRLDVLLYAAEQYEQKFSDVGTVVVGSGPPDAVEHYEGLAKKLGLQRTFFVGAKGQDVLADIFSMSEVGVFPSYKEPFGMVFIECMACGTPVIGANSGGPTEFISDEVGTLIPEEDDWRSEAGARRLGERLGGTISSAITDNWKGTSKGKSCVPFVKANYSTISQCEGMLANMKQWSGGCAAAKPCAITCGSEVMMFHIGTNNWQRQGEFAPGSGILHKSMHETFNSMPGVKCYSIYPSKMQTDPTDDSTFKIFKINHDIPICESVSPNSSYRWHSMNDVEYAAYTKRLENEICAFMDEIEKKEGKQFDYVVSHHAFTNAMTGAQIVERRKKAGNLKLRHYNFVHGTALKMYIKEKEKDPEYPMRFLHVTQSHGVFNSLDGCAGVWVNSVDYIAKFADCFPAYPEDNLVFSRIGVNQNIFRPKGTTITGDLPTHIREEDKERFASSGIKRLVAFVGKFADWKRLDVMLYAAELYESKFDDLGTVVVGSGPPDAVEHYEGLAKKLGLKRTFFVGAKGQDVLADIFSMSEVGVFPSYKEPFGMVFIECMACGTPVIGAKSGGPTEFVTDDVGTLIPEEEGWRSEEGARRLGERLGNMVSLAMTANWKGLSKGKNCVPFVKANYSTVAQCEGMLQNMKDWSAGGAAEESSASNFALTDGRRVKVCEDEVGITIALGEEFVKIANTAIKAKGAFSVCLPGGVASFDALKGSIVQALEKISAKKVDWDKVHVFFVNERIGEGKTYKNALKYFIKKFKIPEEQVYKVGEGSPETVAAEYEALIRNQPRNIIGMSPGGMLSVDLLLLGTGEDGHVGSLHPNKAAIKASGQGKVVIPIDEAGKSSVAVSMDFMCAAKKVILSAALGKRAPMVARALQTNRGAFDCPASIVNAASTLWLVDEDSVKTFREKQFFDPPLVLFKSFWDIPGMKAGVVTGDLAWALLRFAKMRGFAIPAFNCTSTSTVNAVLEAGKKLNRPVIIQFSEGGAAFFAGKSLPNDKKQASILGAVAGAHYVRSVAPAYGIPVLVHSDHCAKKLLPWFDGMLDFDEAFFKFKGEPLFSSHMLDLSEEPHEENIDICKTYLTRMAKFNCILEMEIGITGGVEDGVDNSGVAKDKLYSTPEEVWQVYETLAPISEKFTIAAAFGNVHGVYKPGNVILRPELLGQFQEHASKVLGGAEKPLFFVFHGGSGSAKSEINEALSHGVVKMNVDTDTQWAYWEGLLKFYELNEGFLQGQIGNPKGADKPNKSYYDPRKWVRESEVSMIERVMESCKDLRNVN